MCAQHMYSAKVRNKIIDFASVSGLCSVLWTFTLYPLVFLCSVPLSFVPHVPNLHLLSLLLIMLQTGSG